MNWQQAKQPSNSKRTKDTISKEYAAYQDELNELSRKRKKLTLELKRSNENLVRQKSKIEVWKTKQDSKKLYPRCQRKLVQVKRK